MGHLISPPTLTNIILRVTCYFKCLFLIKKILEFLPTSSFDRGPGEDGVEAWKLSYAGCGKGQSEKDELYSVWSFPSCCLSKAEDHCLRNPHTGRLLCPPNPLPPFPQPRKGLPFIKGQLYEVLREFLPQGYLFSSKNPSARTTGLGRKGTWGRKRNRRRVESGKGKRCLLQRNQFYQLADKCWDRSHRLGLAGWVSVLPLGPRLDSDAPGDLEDCLPSPAWHWACFTLA